MKTKLLLSIIILIVGISSCENKPSGPPNKKSRSTVNSDSTKTIKKYGPKNKNNDELDTVKKELDSLRNLLSQRKNDYVRQKNNYKCQFPELTRIILIEMLKKEMIRAGEYSGILPQEFHDFYDIEYTDKRVLEFIDSKIEDFIAYISNNTDIDFKKVLADSTEFINFKK